jgi:hypothetical protein
VLCEFAWHYVLDLFVLITSLNPRICVISIIRIVTIKRLDLNSDVTYDIVLNNISTSLEPTLGVINACLPVLQPVVSKFSGSMFFLWSKRTLGGGTSRGRLVSKRSLFEPSDDFDSRRLRRIPGDLYPLTDVIATKSDCSGAGPRTAAGKDTDSSNDELEHHSGIKVTQHVGITSAEAHRS